MLFFQLEHDFIFLFVMGFYGLYSFGIVFIACEFGQYVSGVFEEIEDDIEVFDWYLFPHELQRMLPMILIVTQKPLQLKFFGSISLLREYFKKVCFESTQLSLISRVLI